MSSELGSYRARSRAGLVKRKPRRLDLAKAREIRRKYFRREATQMELALEYHVGQSTIWHVVATHSSITTGEIDAKTVFRNSARIALGENQR